MIEREEVIKALRKMIRKCDHDIGVGAALRDAEMREYAEWKRDVYEAAVKLLET